jgi:SAM-dependent methyltransferase
VLEINETALREGVAELAEQHGHWFYDMPLPHGVWTGGNQGLPHTRLKRIAQIISDLADKPLSECRVLDLGCLEGQFAIEFALQGATAVGIEIREANVAKAQFVKEALGLKNVEFHREDARNLENYGQFDAIVCSGLLYHLTSADAVKMVQAMHRMSRLVIIDTHIALDAEATCFEGYSGETFREHGESDSADKKEARRWASADNAVSFWFTRPSLINLLSEAGFSSVYECFTPAHINYGRPGLESDSRCTFVAIKDSPVHLATSPAANELREEWPEGTLTYRPRRLFAKLRRMLR